MSDDSGRIRQKKYPESLRKSRINPRRTITSQLPYQTQTNSEQSTNSIDQDLLNVIIGKLTSDNNDTRVSPTSNEIPLIPTESLQSTKKGVKSKEKRNHSNNFDVKYDSTVRRKSIGDQRREQLTRHMKDLYQDYFQFDQNSIINYNHDNLTNTDKRKQYSTKLW